MTFKRAGFLTKIVVLALLIYMAISLLDLRGKIQDVQAQRNDLARQVEAQREANAALEDDIAHSGDPEYMADIARSKLGLLEPDEIEFVDSSK